VIVKDANEQALGTGITDASGNYSIEVRDATASPIFARYEKIGYFAYPTIRRVASLKGVQPPLALSRGSASAEYYKILVSNFTRMSAEDPKDTAMVAALAGLPPAEKGNVIEQLKGSSPPSFFAKFEAADKTIQSSMALSEKLRSTGMVYRFVNAYPNYPNTGSILLYGSVSDPSYIKAVENIAKSIEGVSTLQNDLRVQR
jgi:hypothetical protein